MHAKTGHFSHWEANESVALLVSLLSTRVKGACAPLFYFSILSIFALTLLEDWDGEFIISDSVLSSEVSFQSYMWLIFAHSLTAVDWILASSKIQMLKPNPQYDGVWRWGLWRWWGHKCAVCMNGTSALMKKAVERSFSLPPAEDAARRRPSVSQEVSPRQTPGLASL